LTLEKSIPRSDKWERAMKSAYAGLSRLEENPPENISELRALEANCAATYFRSWVGLPIKWRGTSRRPIPDNWRSVGQRSSPYHLAGNRNAAHRVNAILNYAYAALAKFGSRPLPRGTIQQLVSCTKEPGVCRLNPEMARMVVAKVST
jgi:CRISP-associated protein Cas1